jgi:hypothetical protein
MSDLPTSPPPLSAHLNWPKLVACLKSLKVPSHEEESLALDIQALESRKFTGANVDDRVSISEVELNDSMYMTIDASESNMVSVLVALNTHMFKLFGRGWMGWRNDSVICIYGNVIKFSDLGI